LKIALIESFTKNFFETTENLKEGTLGRNLKKKTKNGKFHRLSDSFVKVLSENFSLRSKLSDVLYKNS